MNRLAKAALAGSAALLAIAATPKVGNWLSTIAYADGAHQVGNPKAKVKLTEFVSYTCSHCANFEKESEGAIKLYLVQPGNAQIEVRHIIRDVIDLTAAVTTNCGPKEKFFGNHTMLMVSQDEWLGKARTTTPAQRQRWGNGPFGQRARAIAGDLGFYELMAARGYNASQLNACFNDEAEVQRLADQSTADGTTYGVNSTPSFAINGKTLAGVHSWDVLQTKLDSYF